MLVHSIVKHNDTVTTQKFVTLLDIFLNAFKGEGHCVIMDSMYVARWCNIAITIGPEPKPIRKGTTIYSMCVSKGNLAGYKLNAHTFGCEAQRYCHHTKISDTVGYFPRCIQGERTLCDDGFRVHGGYYGPDWSRRVEWSGQPKRITRELLRRRRYKS